jgi:ergothioneine biosynthesis protein EgtB
MPYASIATPSELGSRYGRIRYVTTSLAAPLEPEDMAVQSMPDCSPVKWHLGHTTWFFETIVLGSSPRYHPYNKSWGQLFNSYYLQLGMPWERSRRDLLTRPTCAEIGRYRQHVDESLAPVLDATLSPDLAWLIETGLHHEQQHQELILTDIQHLFYCNPLRPRYRHLQPLPASSLEPLQYLSVAGGKVRIGAAASGNFSFDNERPVHERFVLPFKLANRPVSNAEFKHFVRDGGYRSSGLWLQDGWNWLRQNDIDRPLYWDQGLETRFTLGGQTPLPPDAPVAHLSYFEADAFARWAGARLPREDEWELAAQNVPVQGNFLETGLLQPAPAAPTSAESGFLQLYGDVWEWTQSPYTPYPGFQPEPPPLTEYNGKFMSGQMVLRGGSCLSAREHIRPTYRNFLPPAAQWQVSGIRLACDA